MARTNPGTFYERANAAFLAYITTPAGGLPDSSWIAADGIVVYVYDESAGGTLVHTYTFNATDTGLLPDSIQVLSDAVNQGYGWPDSTGWNLGFVADTSEWNAAAGSVGGRAYRLEWEITYDTAVAGAPDWLAEQVQRFSQRAVCLALTS